jgi:hypothetical protein
VRGGINRSFHGREPEKEEEGADKNNPILK